MDPIVDKIIQYLEDGKLEPDEDLIMGARTFIKCNECMVCEKIGITNDTLSSIVAEITNYIFIYCSFNPKCAKIAFKSLVRHLNGFEVVVEDKNYPPLLPLNKTIKFKRSNGDIEIGKITNLRWSESQNCIVYQTLFDNDHLQKGVKLEDIIELNNELFTFPIELNFHPDTNKDFKIKIQSHIDKINHILIYKP